MDFLSAPPALGYVYMIADQEGSMLYVGSTGDLGRRLHEHKRLSAWWPDAHKIFAATVSDRAMALDFEVTLIGGYQPRYNTAYLQAEFPSMPHRAVGADMAAIATLMEDYMRFCRDQLTEFSKSLTAFVALRVREDETVGECEKRVREENPHLAAQVTIPHQRQEEPLFELEPTA